MSRVLASSILMAAACFLTACTGGNGYTDLDEFMQKADAAPAKPIEALPKMQSYESFTYSEAGSRSPFTPPIEETNLDIAMSDDQSNIKPDLDRPKEVLEFFQLTALRMVGTLQKNESQTLWALVKDNQGGIHRVKPGQHMGKNHGRVVGVEAGRIDLIEIVPNGHGGWIERPRSVTLEDS